MAKPPRQKYLISNADKMRAELGVTANRLAGAAGCSLATTQNVLAGTPSSQVVCEKIINGLKQLGHKEASHEMIEEAK